MEVFAKTHPSVVPNAMPQKAAESADPPLHLHAPDQFVPLALMTLMHGTCRPEVEGLHLAVDSGWQRRRGRDVAIAVWHTLLDMRLRAIAARPTCNAQTCQACN